MILNMKPLTLSEVKELAGNLEEKKELRDYLKKFGKMGKKEAESLKQRLHELGNLKLKEEHAIKIIDFRPVNSEELNRIFNDVSLDEKETNDILAITRGN